MKGDSLYDVVDFILNQASENDLEVIRAALKDGKLPADAIMSMISQFVAYSTESMSITEQIRLREEIPDWHKKYWEQFSPRVRQLISLHIGGQLDPDTFWERVRLELGGE
jgi:hypothetical protein